MAFSYVTYTGNGSITTFAISFDYLPETVVVSADPKGIEVHIDNIKQTSGYTVDTSLNQVVFTTAPGAVSATVQVKIVRVTPRGKADRLVDFADGTVLNEAQLDTSSIQLLYIAQEAFEQSTAGGPGPSGNYLPYNEVEGWWDGISSSATQEIQNIKTGLLDNSVANKKYVDDVAEWGISGVPQAFEFANLTGLTNTFELADAPEVEENMLVVALSGALQVPGTDFVVTGGVTNSDLIFTTPPGSTANPLNLSVQNFGKMRFLDGLQLTAGQVTTEALDQTVGTEAVSTATIRDDAVTADKILDTCVDLTKINTTTFTTASGTGTPRFLSMDPSSTVLGLDTLKTEDVENFTTDIRAQNSVNNLKLPTATWSNNNHKITELGLASAGTDAASKTYVDDAITAAISDSEMTKLKVYEVGANTTSTITLTGWQDEAYKSYVIDIVGVSSNTAGATLSLWAQTGGDFQEGAADYYTQWVCSGRAAIGSAPQGDSNSGSDFSNHATLTCGLSSGDYGTSTRERTAANFQVILPNNYSGAAWKKSIRSRGMVGYGTAYGYGSSSYKVPGAPGAGATTWDITSYMPNSAVITGVQFGLTKSMTGWHAGTISAGAKFIIYGRKY